MKAKKLYAWLFSQYGKQYWWPADSAFEVCIGTILTQSTAWKNVEKAISNLKASNALSLKKIASMHEKKLAFLIRSAGYHNQKAERLRLFCKHLLKNHNGSLKKMLLKKIPELRQELLLLKGIGPETADSIILYAAGKPVFVIDAYTKRLNERLPLKKTAHSYEELQAFFHSEIPASPKVYNEFHALTVKHCKEACRKKPLCQTCFLRKKCEFGKLQNSRLWVSSSS